MTETQIEAFNALDALFDEPKVVDALEQRTEKYIVKSFSSTDALANYINSVAEDYKAISIADTNEYITVLLERRT